jgi:hypothetical protein
LLYKAWITLPYHSIVRKGNMRPNSTGWDFAVVFGRETSVRRMAESREG